jgi:hypothetical protein
MDGKLENPFEPVIERWISDNVVLFTGGELEGLFLAREDSAGYRICVKTVHDAVAGKQGQISIGTVADAIQAPVLKALDFNKKDSGSDFSKDKRGKSRR